MALLRKTRIRHGRRRVNPLISLNEREKFVLKFIIEKHRQRRGCYFKDVENALRTKIIREFSARNVWETNYAQKDKILKSEEKKFYRNATLYLTNSLYDKGYIHKKPVGKKIRFVPDKTKVALLQAKLGLNF